MTARKPPRPGWVTVADAAAALTAAGDPIDASNVSRYLARNPGVPSEKVGKFRWVDLQALAEHRRSSVYVADKREARAVEAPRAPLPPDLDADDHSASAPMTPQARNKLLIQELEIRERLRKEAEAEGRLVPVDDFQVVISAMMGAFAAELARHEANLTARFGAPVGIAVRQAHWEARAAAAARLKAAAQEVLKAAAVERAAAAEPVEAAQAAA